MVAGQASKPMKEWLQAADISYGPDSESSPLELPGGFYEIEDELQRRSAVHCLILVLNSDYSDRYLGEPQEYGTHIDDRYFSIKAPLLWRVQAYVGLRRRRRILNGVVAGTVAFDDTEELSRDELGPTIAYKTYREWRSAQCRKGSYLGPINKPVVYSVPEPEPLFDEATT